MTDGQAPKTRATDKSKLIRMENLRRVVQVLSFVTFLYLFVLTIGKFDLAAKANVLTSRAPIDTFFRIDPLLGLTTMIATRHIITIMTTRHRPRSWTRPRQHHRTTWHGPRSWTRARTESWRRAKPVEQKLA